MDSALVQTPCVCLDLILATGKKLVDEPLVEILAATWNMNIK